jgi:hypothetical protein
LDGVEADIEVLSVKRLRITAQNVGFKGLLTFLTKVDIYSLCCSWFRFRVFCLPACCL